MKTQNDILRVLGLLCAAAVMACGGSGSSKESSTGGTGGDSDGGSSGTCSGSGSWATGSSAATDVHGYLWYAGTALCSFTPSQVGSSSDANPEIMVTASALSAFRDAALDRSGNVWAVGVGSDQVFRFPAPALRASGSASPDLVITSAALQEPSNLVFDSYGNLWVANRRGTTSSPNADGTIVRFDNVQSLTGAQDLSPALTISSTASGPLYILGGIAFDAAGNLWATSWSGIVRFDNPQCKSGDLTLTPDALIPHASDVYYYGIAFDSGGALWAATAIGWSMNSVVKFASPGTLTGSSSPTPVVTMAKPDSWGGLPAGGLAFDKDGNLWMLTGSSIVEYTGPGSLSDTVDPTPAVTLGLAGSATPPLNAHLLIFPTPAGLPIY